MDKLLGQRHDHGERTIRLAVGMPGELARLQFVDFLENFPGNAFGTEKRTRSDRSTGKEVATGQAMWASSAHLDSPIASTPFDRLARPSRTFAHPLFAFITAYKSIKVQ